MSVVRNLIIRAGADFSNMINEIRKAKGALDKFKVGIVSIAKSIAVALGAIGAAFVIKDAVSDAIKVEAAMQVVNRTLGDSAGAFAEWASNGATAFNMTKSAAIRYGAVYSNLVSGFSAGTKETEQRTVDLLKASAVMASGTGRTMEDVLERVRSGLLGNTEAIEDLGVNVNVAMLQSTQAFKQFANGKSWDKLDFRTQQTIRYFGIMEQASSKFGNELNKNTASNIGKLTTSLGNVKLALGQAFLPILNKILPYLTILSNALLGVVRIYAQFTEALFGYSDVQKKTKKLGDQSKAIKGVGKAYDAAGAAAKKAANGVAGFDEVNSLNDPSKDDAAGDGTDTTGPTLPEDPGTASALEPISKKVQEFADKVKAIFKDIKQVVSDNKDIIIASLAGITAGFVAFLIASNWAEIIAGIAFAFETLGEAAKLMWLALTGPIGIVIIAVAAVVAAFVYFYETNETFRGVVDGILRAIGNAAVWLWNNVLVPFGAWLATVFVASWNAITVAAEWFWKNILVPLGIELKWFWDNVVTPLAAVFVDVLGVAWTTLSTIAESFWKNVLIPLGTAMKEEFKPTVETLVTVFDTLGKGLQLLWDNILKPFGTWLLDHLKKGFQDIVDVIQALWAALKPVAEWVGSTLAQVFDTAFTSIGDIITKMQGAFDGLLTFITGIFTGDWQKAWDGLKTIFKNVFESLAVVAKTPINLIITMINSVIDALNSISFDVPDWVPGVGGKHFGIKIPKIPQLAKGGIVDSPTIAQIGEAGPEAVVPLKNTAFVDTLAGAIGTAVMGAMQFSGGSQKSSGDVNLSIDGTTFARVVAPYLAKESTRIGGTMIAAK